MSAKGAAVKRKAKKKAAPAKKAALKKKGPPASKKKTKAPEPKITKKPAAPKKTKKVAAKAKKTAAPKKAKPAPKPPVAKKPAPIKAPVPVVANEEPVRETHNVPVKKPGVLRVAKGERRPVRNTKKENPVEIARAALARVGTDKTQDNGQMKKTPTKVVEINPKLESSREKIESKPAMPGKPPSVAEKKRQEAEAAFQKIAPQHNELTKHFHKSVFDVRISERDSLATQIRMSGSHEEALRAARELADRYRLPPDQVTLLRIVELGDERLTKMALEELLELDDKGRVRPTSDLITTVTAIHSKDAETIELKDLLLEKVRPR
jgi:hypothetical protein